ncbi:Calx-beta domain-containing protein, partial [Microcoleus sp. w2-18aC6]|uniref:Calx-beta domain-containing protein n=2 Tax=Microcoleus TaxID=44471 RepID=UPI002FD2227D
VTLFLDQNNNGQLDSLESATQTDSLGGYAFPNLLPATYTVEEIVPPDFTRLTPVQPVTVVANQTTNFDILNSAGTITTVTGSISGRKFIDVNVNGIPDVGEPGIAGFTIYIDLNRNNTLDSSEPSTLTDATGSYQFNDLQPNTYILREVQQPGFVATQVPNPVTIPPGRGFNAENINFGNAPTTPPIGIPGILQFSNPSYSVNEDGTTSLEVMVTRTGGSLGTVDVTVLASDGTANAGTDYNATPITVSFIDGDTTPKTIRIPIINDALFEPNETINLSLVNPTNGATLGVQTAATLIINRSDSGVPLNIDNVGNLQSIAREPLIRESGFDLSANALAIVSAQQGGSGNFIDPLINPGQVARGITYNEGQSIIINVANGFDQQFSFRYASPFAEHQVTIYEGVNGTGNVLASVPLPRTTDSNLTPGAYILESNPSSNLLFQGIGKSVILGNQPNKLVIGDITFG